jgi:hypothetical protein
VSFLRRPGLLDCFLLAGLTFALINPLFRLKYLDNWPSIESTFISDARMLNEHLPHPGWQPLWYCGTRTDYIYPPALRYGTVLISRLTRTIPARAYHLYIGIFYILGILSVSWLVRTGCSLSGSRARAPALLAGVAAALLSPCFLLMGNLRHDSGYFVPQRLHVLMAWGEGPHISSLALLPAALAAAMVAFRHRKSAALALAALLCSLVVANNFYGATALAILYPILVWSVWVTDENRAAAWRSLLLRAVSIPALAWGLSAFWLTPSYLRITLLNLKWVSQPPNGSGRLAFAITLAAFGIISFLTVKARPDRLWTTFVIGAALALGVYVLGAYYFGWVVTGDAIRLAPELDLALILLSVEALRLLWQKPRLRVALVLATLLAFWPSVRYIRHAWSPFPKAAPLENVYQYKTAGWVHDHLPGARVLPVGTVRFWFDAWSDNTQLDGGSMQGLLNQNIPAATWQILHGDRADLALLWLKALATDAIIVPGKTSLEPYHDYEHQEKFQGVLQPIYDDGQGTLIYPVPRAHPGIAQIVDTAALNAAPPVNGGDDLSALTKYVTAVEASPQTASLQWRGTDEASVHGVTAAGQSVLLQETWDPAWRAFENGKPVPIRVEDKMGFMLLDLPPGVHDIFIRFETPLGNRFGEGIFGLSVLLTGFLAFGFLHL